MIEPKLKQKIISLRRRGLSYGDIKKFSKISKSTIGTICKNITLTEKQKQILIDKRNEGQRKATERSSVIRKKQKHQNEKYLASLGKKNVGVLSRRDRFIAGISLYMADGTKRGSCVDFTNSDSKIITFMVGWFKEFLEVELKDIKACLWLHKNLYELGAISYWENLTGIPKANFGKTYFAENKQNSRKIRKQKHNNGVIKIRVYSVVKLRLIKGWIEGVLK